MQERKRQARVAAVAATVVVALLAPDPVRADHVRGHPKGNAPAVDQYVEQIPTSSGPRATTPPGPVKTQRKPLPARTAKRLRETGGKDAPLLQEIATSSVFGAPQTTLRKPRGKSVEALAIGSDADDSVPAVDDTLGAAVSAITGDAGTGRLVVLALLLAGITVAAVGTATYRRRAPGNAARRYY